MSNNYIFPLERPLSRGGFDICDGPDGTRWAAWVGTTGIFYGPYVAGQVMDDLIGQPNTHFTNGERPSKLSICFDENGNSAIAIQSDPNTITIGWNRQVTLLTGFIPLLASWPGLSPLVIFNQKAIVNQFQKNIVVFYLKADGRTIFARFRSDAFTTEHTLNASLPTPLARLFKADILQIGGSFYQLIWAETQDGRMVFLKSDLFPIIIGDSIRGDVTLEGSSYFIPIVPPDVTEGMTIDAALEGASYLPTVKTGSITDGMTEDAALHSGLYQNTVVIEAKSEAMTENATLQSGSYA